MVLAKDCDLTVFWLEVSARPLPDFTVDVPTIASSLANPARMGCRVFLLQKLLESFEDSVLVHKTLNQFTFIQSTLLESTLGVVRCTDSQPVI